MKYLLVVIFLIFSIMGQAQDKIEFEKRIDVATFPVKAYEQLQPYLAGVKRVKYYQEFDGNSQSFEAKFKKFGARYSVEFNTQGQVQDVEIKVLKSQLDTITKDGIKNYFDAQYERWKIEKIQLQFYDLKTLEAATNTTIMAPLEIIVATKNKGKLVKYEYLFDNNLVVVSKRKIVRQSYDFLLF